MFCMLKEQFRNQAGRGFAHCEAIILDLDVLSVCKVILVGDGVEPLN